MNKSGIIPYKSFILHSLCVRGSLCALSSRPAFVHRSPTVHIIPFSVQTCCVHRLKFVYCCLQLKWASKTFQGFCMYMKRPSMYDLFFVHTSIVAHRKFEFFIVVAQLKLLSQFAHEHFTTLSDRICFASHDI